MEMPPRGLAGVAPVFDKTAENRNQKGRLSHCLVPQFQEMGSFKEEKPFSGSLL